jgi:hypothetical protein
MPSVADLFLRSLLEKFPHPSSQKVMGDLPQEIAKRFSLLPDRVGVDPENFLVTPSRILSSLHPSWYEELVKAVPEEMRPIVHRCLEEYREEKEASPFREFILGYLVSRWSERDIPCLETVERGDFSWLLECSPEEIETISSLVGTYDLVEEVRKTIDKKSLEKLFSSLSPMQRRYLRALLHTPLPGLKSTISLPEFLRLPIEEGKERLLTRGYERLAAALQGQGELFIWYLLHRLERSQALSLERRLKEGSSEETSRSKVYLTHAYQFLKRRESK